ncbi:hypothetical protein QBC47DRAFT_194935 [Echria macrotheca]|uniref:Uncharacterized protein n=1 Tax=Echria macrotheca TaxID=438768 RepID=A0AAJ0BCG7_9PEZI|nr:hypothetical protein QBC47DRAFT_194935 [Echria macrotheca]
MQRKIVAGLVGGGAFAAVYGVWAVRKRIAGCAAGYLGSRRESGCRELEKRGMIEVAILVSRTRREGEEGASTDRLHIKRGGVFWKCSSGYCKRPLLYNKGANGCPKNRSTRWRWSVVEGPGGAGRGQCSQQHQQQRGLRRQGRWVGWCLSVSQGCDLISHAHFPHWHKECNKM